MPDKPRQTSANRWLGPLGLVMTALWLAQACVHGANAPDATAPELLQTAHDGRAVWHKFPGFQGNIVGNRNGAVVSGRVVVSASGSVEITAADSADAAWLQRSLESLVGHRLADSDPEKNVTFADENTQHPFGRLIKSTDPANRSLWRVKGDVLTEVHRISDQVHFVISVADVWRTTDGKHLPRNFSVETWDRATGRLTKSRQVHTQWVTVDGVDLPQSWWAVENTDGTGRSVTQWELQDLQLLK